MNLWEGRRYQWTDSNITQEQLMKHIKAIGGVVAVLAGAMLGARGQDFRTDINPALTYYRSFLLAPDAMTNTDTDYLDSNAGRSKPIPARFDAIFAGFDRQFLLARQAAHATVPCDWGVDWSPGPETLLPQLARVKRIAVMARYRARWELQQNRPDDARDDLLAAFVAGRNGSQDGSLISVLVQLAVENLVCSAVAENFYQFPPETLEQLVAGMDAAPVGGTAAGSVAVEKIFSQEWLPNRVQELQKEYPGDDAKVMATIGKIFDNPGDGSTNPWPRIAGIAGNSAGLLKLAHDMQPLYAQMGEILALPHGPFEDRMSQFNAEIQNSPNPLVTELIPAAEKSRAREFGGMETLAMVHAAVAYQLRGEEGFDNVMDPCGQGPFQMQRFVFQGVDRGFELKGAYDGRGYPEVMIFVEKNGPAFYVNGKNAGLPVTP
jgi:hypothetical protein